MAKTRNVPDDDLAEPFSGANSNDADAAEPSPHGGVDGEFPKHEGESSLLVDYQEEVGGIALSFVSVPGDKPAFSLRDRHGNAYVVEPAERKSIRLHDVNLIGCDAQQAAWALTSSNRYARLSKNIKPEWKLAGEDTYYLASDAATEHSDEIPTVSFLDPIDRGDIPVKPLTRYQFIVLAATHRCAGALKLSFRTDKGELSDGLTHSIDRSFKGGTSKSDYHRIAVQFVTPANARALCVQIQKGKTEQKNDSYVFFCGTALREIHGIPTRSPIALPFRMLEHFRTGGNIELAQVKLQAPTELFESGFAAVDLTVQLDGEPTTVRGLTLTNISEIEITKFNLDGGRVTFRGKSSGETSGTLRFYLYVDGDLSATIEVGVEGRGFSGQVQLNAKHLDGLPHLVELRSQSEILALAGSYEILPMQITPWSALRDHARAPLDGTLSPAARRHFMSLEAWMEKLETDPATRIPVAEYKELLAGFRKRDSYPKLKFASVKKPTVSVVIPVHNKFEITYFCLCALQFAYNETTFEVIIVDDGSSDQTVDIQEFVEGVKVIRHETSVGFVGSCNDGAAAARGEFVMLLNNDTEVTARWLDDLVSVFRDFNDVGLAGSKLLYPDGRLQEAGGIVWGSGNPWNVGRSGNASDPSFNYLRQTDYVSGAAIMIPLALWKKVGGLSSEFSPAYFEDTDLAMKIRAEDKRVVYVPSSVVYHYEGQSAGTDTSSGMKRFQEVNRPKFKKKWIKTYSSHGVEGTSPEREKDRNTAMRVLFVDQHIPNVDKDAGSYAAFQEIRLFQSQGAKVTFLPRNLAFMDRHTLALQRIGVECLYAPFVMDFSDYIRKNAANFDVIYITRYKVGEQINPIIRAVAPNAKIILNLADLHFLRELREAAAKMPGYTIERAEATRDAELGVIKSCDLTLSYSDVELAIIESHVSEGAATAKLPWIVDVKPRTKTFEETQDILFLGGFGHPPNEHAVIFFATQVMPLIRERLPNACFNVVGSEAPESIKQLASETVRIVGYLPDLEEAFASARVFVAPLLAGAGLKGKVIEAIARGVPSVLSPVASEASGLTSGRDCFIAQTAMEWADAVIKLYTDKTTWERVGKNAQEFAQNRYSFASGVEMFQQALAKVDVFGREDWGLVYRHTRPHRYGN